MVKFGKQFEANVVKEWEEHYLQYGVLKNLIHIKVDGVMHPWVSPRQRSVRLQARLRKQRSGSLAARGMASPVAEDSRPAVRSSSSLPPRRSASAHIARGDSVALQIEAKESMTEPMEPGDALDAAIQPDDDTAPLLSHDGSPVRIAGTFGSPTPLLRTKSMGTKFAVELERQLERVNNFFMDKMNEFEMSYEELTSHQVAGKFNRRMEEQKARSSSSARKRSTAGSTGKRSIVSQGGKQRTSSLSRFEDDFDDDEEPVPAKEVDSLKRAFIDLYRHVKMLESFKMMNYTAVVKILKKHDKKVRKGLEKLGTEDEDDIKARMLKKKVMAWVESLAFTNDREISDLGDRVELAFARRFTQGDAQIARMELLVKHERATHWGDFETGLRLGAVMVLVIWVLWDCLVDADRSLESVANMMNAVLPVYRATGCLILLVWCWGLDIYVWTRARVNYLYLFDSDTRYALGYRQVWHEASNLTIFYLTNFLLFFKVVRKDTYTFLPAPVFPTILILFMLWRVFFPWKQRKGLWSTVISVMAAPFGRVLYRDTFVGDVMTSLVKVFVDLAYTVCFMGSGKFLQLAPGNADITQGEWCATTPVYLLVVDPIMHAAPLWFRMNQNLRRYYDTKHRFPHLANAFKYAFAMTVGLFGVFHPNYKNTDYGVTLYQVVWVVIYMTSTLYTYSWDVTQDWSLCRWRRCGNHRNPGLRKVIMYRRKYVYLLAICADFILRFFWTFSLVPQNQLPPFVRKKVDYVLLPFLAAAEICRRTMWAMFRLENEHLNNVGDFRRVDYVPLHFATAVAAPKAPTRKSQKTSALLEVAIFVGIVIVLAGLAVISHFF